MSVCTAIEKVRTDHNGDLLRVTIDNTVTALWFYDYADSLQFLNQEVIVEYRNDILDGTMQQFIKTFVRPRVVTTLDKVDNFKLYVEQEDNNANVSFNEIESGDTKHGAIVFCSCCEIKSSKHASWLELLIRDKFMHVAKLRLFNYDTKEDFTGHYICCSLERNQYGFKTDRIVPAGGDIAENKEISVAKQFVENFFAGDLTGSDYLYKTNLLNAFDEHVDYEKGYGVVRLAMELSLVDAMANVTKDFDLQSVGYVILCRYGYLTRNSVLSAEANNLFIAQQFMFPNRQCVVKCLDVLNDERPAEATLVDSIVNTVDSILKVRKGFVD